MASNIEKTLDHLIAENFEYQPNPLEGQDIFLQRKKNSLSEWYKSRSSDVHNGFFIFSNLQTENGNIKSLLDKFMSLDKLLEKECEGKSPEDIAKSLMEKNLFGLTEEDFKYLLEITKQADEAGNHKEATWMYQALSFIFPNHIEPWLNWGNVEFQHFFDYQNVVSIYENCAQIFNYPIVYYCLAICHIKGDEINTAKECLKKAIQLGGELGDTDTKAKAEDMLKNL
jgi:tetratricopeptide (TPR) repeat protein